MESFDIRSLNMKAGNTKGNEYMAIIFMSILSLQKRH